MKRIDLTDEQYDLLISELIDGETFRQNSDSIYVTDGPSKILPTIEANVQDFPEQSPLVDVIQVLRNREIKIEDPYDLENWLADNASHSQCFATGLFKHED